MIIALIAVAVVVVLAAAVLVIRRRRRATRVLVSRPRAAMPEVLVTDAVRQALADTYTYDGPVTLQVKGRSASVDVYGIAE